ncbi:hypothetical protein ES703_66934 [subsurface metagenome]
MKRREFEFVKESISLSDSHPDGLADREAFDLDAQCLRIEALLSAGGTRDVFSVAAEKDSNLDSVFFFLQAVKEPVNSFITAFPLKNKPPPVFF